MNSEITIQNAVDISTRLDKNTLHLHMNLQNNMVFFTNTLQIVLGIQMFLAYFPHFTRKDNFMVYFFVDGCPSPSSGSNFFNFLRNIVTTHKTMQCHNSEDHNQNTHYHKN